MLPWTRWPLHLTCCAQKRSVVSTSALKQKAAPSGRRVKKLHYNSEAPLSPNKTIDTDLLSSQGAYGDESTASGSFNNIVSTGEAPRLCF